MTEQDFKLHVTVVGWLHVLESIIYIGIAAISIVLFCWIGVATQDPQALGILSVVGFAGAALFLLFGVPVALAGWGLLTRKSWSRVLAMVLAILGLFLFPIGTIVGIYVLWVLTSEPAGAYFGEPEETQPPDQAAGD